MTNRYMKICSTLFIIREMEIKTSMKNCLILIRMTVIKEIINNKCQRGCVEKGTFLHCWWECKLVQPLWKTIWSFLRKLKIELPCDQAISLLGVYLKKKNTYSKSCTPVFIAALFIFATIQMHPKCPSADKWIKKMWYIFKIYGQEIKRHKLHISSVQLLSRVRLFATP